MEDKSTIEQEDSEVAVVEKTEDLISWFYVDSTNIFLTPELICGKSCILLLDADLLFQTHPLLKGQHEKLGFQQATFEVSPNSAPYLHILFTESIDLTSFIKSLNITQHSIMSYSDTLINIKKRFYEKARQIFGFRVDVLVQGSIEIGLNNSDQKVYSSVFNRYTVKPKVDEDKTPDLTNLLPKNTQFDYTNEPTHLENGIDFLRATTPDSISLCCMGFVREAIKSKRNVTLEEIKNLSITLFQKNDHDLNDREVSPYQILLVLNTVISLYIKFAHIVPENLKTNVFDDIGVYRSLCLTHESSPTYPRQQYTNYIANDYSTPLPISFIMQKVLVGKEHFFDSNSIAEKEDFAILNPMFGYGALTNILSQRNFLVTGLEINRAKVNLIESLKYQNLSISCHDCLSIEPKKIKSKHNNNPIKYVIGNFACFKTEHQYEYGNVTDHQDPTRFKFDPIIVQRSDFITILDTLKIREEKGRSVFLIPYFNTNAILYQTDIEISDIERTQDKDLLVLLNFINQRYKIESIKGISSELYSKSLKRVSPLILVVGERLTHLDQDKQIQPISTYFNDQNIIRDYESMWAWAKQICFNQTSVIESKMVELKRIEKIEVEYLKRKANSPDEEETNEEKTANQAELKQRVEKINELESQFKLKTGNQESLANATEENPQSQQPLDPKESLENSTASDNKAKPTFNAMASMLPLNLPKAPKESNSSTTIAESSSEKGEIKESDPIDPEKPKDPADPVDSEKEKAPADPVDSEKEKNPADPVDSEKEKTHADPVDSEKEKTPADPVDSEKEKTPADPVDSEKEKTPADPVDSEKPKDPADPVDSEKEKTPADPVDSEKEKTPADPVDSEKEKTPADPVDSEKPKDPADPVESKQKKKTDFEKEVDRLQEIYSQYEISTQIEKNKKIASPSSNLFDLSERNKIIRYPSGSLINEPRTNVHQKEFSSYLLAQKNLADLVANFYAKSPNDMYKKYTSTNNLTPTIDSLVSFFLKVKSPMAIKHILTSEQFDLLATAILKLDLRESVLCADSKSLDNSIVSACLTHINKLNNRKTVIVTSDESFFDDFSTTYEALIEEIQTPDQNKHITYLFLHSLTNADAKKIEHQIKKADVVFILNDVKFLPFYASYIKHLKNSNITSIFHEDLSSPTLSHEVNQSLLLNPTLFITDSFIRNKSELLVIKNLIPQQVKERYFLSINGELDDMSIFLFKKNLIEDLTLLQRFDDLSNVRLSFSNPTHAWINTHNSISIAISDVLNNILILIEQLQPLQSQIQQLDPFALRQTAMRIHTYCCFCIQSISLTRSIFDSVRNHIKPIVCLPDCIEDIIFDLMERVGDAELPLESQILSDLNIIKFSELNAYINQSTHELSLIHYEFADQAEIEKSVSLSAKIKELNKIRAQVIFDYLTKGNKGKESKLPNIQSIIALFYRAFCFDSLQTDKNLSDKFASAIVAINEKISSIVDVPLNAVDFMRYELSKYQIISSEISQNAISIEFDNETETWGVGDQSPLSDKYSPSNARRKIIEANFNSGGIDVLFVDTNELSGLNFASIRTQSYKSIDYIRKRSLFIVDFNISVSSVTSLIHHLQSPNQFVPPEIHCHLSGSYCSTTMFRLLVKQLGLFNIFCNDDFVGIPDLSYLLSGQGQKLLSSYISVTPIFNAYSANNHSSDWFLFDFIRVLSLTNNPTQIKVLKDLRSLIIGHLSYLRDSKTNPFDVFDVSPEAFLRNDGNVGFPLKLNKTIHEDAKTSFRKEISTSSLLYVKNVSNALTMDLCKALYINHMEQERKSLLELLSLEDQAQHTLSHLVSIYTTCLEKRLILTFRERIQSLLQNRHGQWIYESIDTDHELIKKQFKLSNNKLRISKYLQQLYFDILIIADQNLLSDFHQACRILSFFKSYSLTLKNKTTSLEDLIVLPIQSPFREKNVEAFEGFLLSVKYPSSAESMLISKSYLLNIAYPTKSKPTKISLKYALDDVSFMRDQSVLHDLAKYQDKILQFFKKKNSRLAIKQQISSIKHQPLIPFPTLCNMNTDLSKTPIALKFNELSDKDHPTKKVRSMDILRGNLFEIYYALKDIVPLTMVSFHNENLINEYAFVISPSEDMHTVVNTLEQFTLLSNIPTFLNKLISKNPNQSLNYSGFNQVSSIKWFGELGSLQVKGFTKNEATISFKGTKDEFAKLIKNKYLFLSDKPKTASKSQPKTPPKPKPVPKKQAETGQIPLGIDSDTPQEEQIQPIKQKWSELDVSNGLLENYANNLTLTFVIPIALVPLLASEISSKSLYNMALVDTSIKLFN